MTFLPIVARELRVAARRPHTYWTRFFAVLVVLGLSALVWLAAESSQPAHERGQILFRFIAGVAFTYSLLAGIAVTSDSLSEEKRESTLGLLFLTDLKGYDVVLGKLAATSLNASYRLLSILPILAIPLLLGALTLAEFWRMALVLTNTLFFSLSAGMLTSALSLRERRAMIGTALAILMVTAGPPLLGLIVAHADQTTPYDRAFLLSSAVYPLLLTMDAAYKLHMNDFWSAVTVTHLLGWAFLTSASVLVRHAWQDRTVGRSGSPWRVQWSEWQFGDHVGRASLRARLLEINPILWRTGRDRLKPVYPLVMLAVAGLIWLWLFGKYRHGLLDAVSYILIAYGLHTTLKLWLASEACRPLAEDRSSGALELLLSTPLSVDDILQGEILGLKRQFAWPVGLVLLLDLVMLMSGMGDTSFDSSNDWFFLCLALIVMFVADLYTLAWVGLWLSLRSRKVNRATAATISRVLILPWATFVLGLTLLTLLEPGNFESGNGSGVLGAGFALAMINDAILFSSARRNLRQHFRLAATQRFQSVFTPESTLPQADANPANPAVVVQPE